MVSVSVRVVCACVCLVTCFFVHRLFQQLYYEYCAANIFMAYLFKNSKFCVILNESVRAMEAVFNKFLL